MENLFSTETTNSPAGRIPIILLHGAGSTSLSWHGIRRLLRNRRVWVPDLPGHGRSEGNGYYSIEDYAKSVLAWMNTVSIYQAVLCGHSMGGLVALEFGIREPERTAGLILMSCGVSFPFAKEWIEELVLPVTMKSRVADLVQRVTFPLKDPKWKALLRQEVETSGTSRLRHDLAACYEYECSERLHAVQAPTQVICGDQDGMLPLGSARALAQGIKDSRITVLPGAGHMLPVAYREESARAMNDALTTIHIP